MYFFIYFVVCLAVAVVLFLLSLFVSVSLGVVSGLLTMFVLTSFWTDWFVPKCAEFFVGCDKKRRKEDVDS